MLFLCECKGNVSKILLETSIHVRCLAISHVTSQRYSILEYDLLKLDASNRMCSRAGIPWYFKRIF